MAQHINLCTPILLSEKRYFSAQTMVQALAVFLVLGGVLCAAWVWNLQSASQGFGEAMATQTREIESLQAAIQRSRANAAPVDPALLQQLQDKRNATAARTKLLAALRDGILVPGFAHSDRLQWVARSIPDPVWVSDVKLEEGRFEVAGWTLEPAALNEWVAKLSTSALMHGVQLSNVKVENTSLAAHAAGTAVVSVSRRPSWSFVLVGARPPPAIPAAGAASAPGGKP
jgi:Tfp pilus assembly protein PilN